MDYLLLLHHLGCKGFLYMCCFNITDNSHKVSHFIGDIHDQFKKSKLSTGLFDGIGNWGSYLRDVITIWSLIFVLCLFFCMCCCMCCLMAIMTA